MPRSFLVGSSVNGVMKRKSLAVTRGSKERREDVIEQNGKKNGDLRGGYLKVSEA